MEVYKDDEKEKKNKKLKELEMKELEIKLEKERKAYDEDIIVHKPILPYSSMFVFSSSNP